MNIDEEIFDLDRFVSDLEYVEEKNPIDMDWDLQPSEED